MCATCGCGVDPGSVETIFAKNYQCLDCGEVFKSFGWKPECLHCKSRNTKVVR